MGVTHLHQKYYKNRVLHAYNLSTNLWKVGSLISARAAGLKSFGHTSTS
jgi:hypothetical protein